MGMKPYHYVECDGDDCVCVHAVGIDDRDVEAAEAKRLGWRHIGESWICPSCVAKKDED